jgi:hypothetical protein
MADCHYRFAMTGYIMENKQLGHYPPKPYSPLDLKFEDFDPDEIAEMDFVKALNGSIPGAEIQQP